MKMNFAAEGAIRELGNEAINRVMDMWHKDVLTYFNRDIEILVGNRRKHPALSQYRGLNTQVTLSVLDKKTYLAVWYDPFDIIYSELLAQMGYGQELINTMGSILEASDDPGTDYEPSLNLEKLDWDLLLRRIIFWILRVRGYKKLANKESRYLELETLINTECWTPPLNNILQEMEYDFRTNMTSVVDDTLEGMAAMDQEPPRRVDRAVNAIRLWNLLEVCSGNDKKRIYKVLTDTFPRILEVVERTGKLAEGFDLNDSEGNHNFAVAFIKENRLPGDWEAVDEIRDLMKTL